ncbi:hypothetical protein [sulfur-oxidizing endosymbiont of Gigantopelta aegis]|uniref:hypothetical protein n=1 Tax=sulfur-oxidizing endosymbiont of Gigantopelta aegis TaxID=2794934 RepID=UPI0018DC39B0|nr:hypothetical protein [sulfur-oxidizing endosymbiont of Gigantopelta aegis]
MAYIITSIASILFLTSIMLLFFTSTMKNILFFFFAPRWINTVIILRMLMGFIIIAAAPFTGFPNMMLFLGIAVIFLAMTMPFFSEDSLHNMSQWWLDQSNWMLRLYAIIFAPIWLFFVFASLPDPGVLEEVLHSFNLHTH